MTVRELIERLQEYDAELTVWTYVGDEAVEIDIIEERWRAGRVSVWLS